MKTRIAVLTIAAGLLLSAAVVATAQDSTSTTQQTTTTTTTQDNSMSAPDSSAVAAQDNSATQNDHSDVRTLTGCLQKGDGANEYQLTGQDGSTWELRSDAVDLASHVGHTVTVTGAVRNSTMHGMKEDTKREAQEHGMDKGATEHGHLTVTHVRMVSRSCS
ncbi:MAG TPA: hypothetical protein VFB04_02595 [Terriglobales bacterium]|nr:hypothetical protein [Terriglobales bacterium]